MKQKQSKRLTNKEMKHNISAEEEKEMEKNNYSDVRMDVVVFSIFPNKSTG